MAKVRITVEAVSEDTKLSCTMSNTIEYKNVSTLQEKATTDATDMVYNVCSWIAQSNDSK